MDCQKHTFASVFFLLLALLIGCLGLLLSVYHLIDPSIPDTIIIFGIISTNLVGVAMKKKRNFRLKMNYNKIKKPYKLELLWWLELIGFIFTAGTIFLYFYIKYFFDIDAHIKLFICIMLSIISIISLIFGIFVDRVYVHELVRLDGLGPES